MSTLTTTNPAPEITRLHAEIVDALRSSLEKALRIGEFLTEQKAALPHGEFGPWVAANLPFSDRTAQRYMRLHRERDRIKTDTVSDLGDAYRLLSSHRKQAENLTDREALLIRVHNEAIRVLRDDDMPDAVRLQQLDLIFEPLGDDPVQLTLDIADEWRVELERNDITAAECVAIHNRAITLQQPLGYFNILMATRAGELLNSMEAETLTAN